MKTVTFASTPSSTSFLFCIFYFWSRDWKITEVEWEKFILFYSFYSLELPVLSYITFKRFIHDTTWHYTPGISFSTNFDDTVCFPEKTMNEFLLKRRSGTTTTGYITTILDFCFPFKRPWKKFLTWHVSCLYPHLSIILGRGYRLILCKTWVELSRVPIFGSAVESKTVFPGDWLQFQ